MVERTAPNHSWRNPVERIIMSVINLGLQCVGTNAIQGQLSSEFEKNANNLNAVREATK